MVGPATRPDVVETFLAGNPEIGQPVGSRAALRAVARFAALGPRPTPSGEATMSTDRDSMRCCRSPPRRRRFSYRRGRTRPPSRRRRVRFARRPRRGPPCSRNPGPATHSALGCRRDSSSPGRRKRWPRVAGVRRSTVRAEPTQSGYCHWMSAAPTRFRVAPAPRPERTTPERAATPRRRCCNGGVIATGSLFSGGIRCVLGHTPGVHMQRCNARVRPRAKLRFAARSAATPVRP